MPPRRPNARRSWSRGLPQRVRDPPALRGAHEVEVLVVGDGVDGGGRGGLVDVVDLDLNAAVGAVLGPGALPGELEHPRLRGDPELLARASLGELWVQRALHPRRVAVEPAFEVVEDRAGDGLGLA